MSHTGHPVNKTCAATSLREAAWKARLLEALYKQLPQCEGRVAYADVGSPLTNDFYLGSVKGEVYGLEHTVERYATLNAQLALHPQTTVRGLFMTGQDTMNVVRRRPPSPASNGQRCPSFPSSAVRHRRSHLPPRFHIVPFWNARRWSSVHRHAPPCLISLVAPRLPHHDVQGVVSALLTGLFTAARISTVSLLRASCEMLVA